MLSAIRLLSIFTPRLPARLVLIALLAAIATCAEIASLLAVVTLALEVAGSTLPPVFPELSQDLPRSALIAGAALLAGSVLALHWVIAWLSSTLAAAGMVGARLRTLSTFSTASWPTVADRREGQLQDSAGQLSIETAVGILALTTQVSAGVSLGLLATGAMVIDARTALVVGILGVLVFLLLRPLSIVTHRSFKAFVAANSELVQDIGGLSRLAMELRAFGVAQMAAASLDHRIDHVGAQYRRAQFVARLGTTVYRDLALVAIVLGLGLLTVSEVSGLAQVGTVALLSLRSIGYAQAVQATRQQVQQYRTSTELLIDRVKDLQSSTRKDGRSRLLTIGEIRLDNVHYRYDDRPALFGINLRISSGETIGIVGPSGGGKTTLAQVLLGLRLPTQGEVLVDGVPYPEVDEEDWRRLVAFVAQEPQLIPGSITDNVRFFRPNITNKAVERAIVDAHLKSDVLRLPHGLDTDLGPRGLGLSGGQKQRLAIARALAGSPSVLILDEPTSALDPESELLIRQTLRGIAGRMTLIMIAHRSETLSIADRIVEVAEGRLIE